MRSRHVCALELESNPSSGTKSRSGDCPRQGTEKVQTMINTELNQIIIDMKSGAEVNSRMNT